MFLINEVSSFIVIISSFYIAYLGFVGYGRARFNHEINFLWATSMSLMCLTYIMYLVEPIVHLNGINWIAHSLDTLTFILQACVIYIMTRCDEKHNCKFCKRKKARIFGWIAGTASMLVIAFVYCNSVIDTSVVAYQILGVQWFDILLETLHTVIAFCIYLMIPYDKYLRAIKMGFMFAWLGELTQLLNIISSRFSNVILYNYKWFITTVGILILVYGVYKVVTKEVSK